MHRRKGKVAVVPTMTSIEMTPEELRVFDYEVCWCIEQLNKLSETSNEKQKRDIELAIRLLKDPKAALIKKKQAMRQFLGNYKGKVEESIKKTKEIEAKFKCSAATGQVIRLADCDSKSFKFNFPNHKPLNECSNESEKETSIQTGVFCDSIPLSNNSFLFNFS